MDKEQHEFVDDMGHHMVGWGLPRNTGLIYAYLLLRTEPASLDQIAADLGIAKSGVSVGTRQLVAMGMARGMGERGSRRLLYEALHSVDAIFAARNTRAQDLMDRLRQGARAAPPGPARERLEDMAHVMEALLRELPALLTRLREGRRE